MRKPSKWRHAKYSSRVYSGHFRYVRKEREFLLVAELKNGKKHCVSFESPEAAKAIGWRKKR